MSRNHKSIRLAVSLVVICIVASSSCGASFLLDDEFELRSNESRENETGESDSVIKDRTGPTKSCNFKCHQPVKDAKVCGSDGRFHSSSCEMELESCRKNSTIHLRAERFCRHLTRVRYTNRALRRLRRRVKLVELKRRCDSVEYEEMKSMLLNEFDYNIRRLFEYLDANRNEQIEAHELWPREFESDRGEARVWLDRTGKCSASLSEPRCWSYLDFAFEPKYPDRQNPCSLSHLMLFDLKAPNSRFNFQAFERIFDSSSDQLPAPRKPNKKSQLVELRLGDKVTLSCGKRNFSEQISEPTDGSNLFCWWNRFDVNLASIQDPHFSIEPRTQLLTISDAQLYLSGQYKCNCKRQDQPDESSYSEQVTHLVQVLCK